MSQICSLIANMGIDCESLRIYPNDLENQFQSHIANYGLSYGTHEEYSFRFQQYKETDEIINKINSDPNNTYTSGHNFFSTLTENERKRYFGKKAGPKIDQSKVVTLDESSIKATGNDWRLRGAVNPIQN